MGLRIKLLGQFEIYRNGQPVAQTEWRTEKNKDLLKLLALYPDQPLAQDWLMEALWPDQDPDRSVRNLRGRISEIRRILEPDLSQGSESRYIKTISSSYRLETRHCRIDTTVFEACYRQALAQAKLDADRAIRAFKRAAAIYLGDLLPSDRHKEWTFERCRELRRLYMDALRQLTELLYQHRQYDDAIHYGERALQADPHDERIYRTLMRSHHERGNAHAALQLYERCRRALEASDMSPSEATDHLFETVRHQAYRFSEHVNIEDKLRTIAARLASEPDEDERWDLMGQRIEHLHELRRRTEEADALRAAETLAREAADPGKLGRVFIKWADYYRALGDWAASERSARRARDRFRAIDDPLGAAEAAVALGCCCAAQRDVDGAHRYHMQALESVKAADGLRADRIRIRVWSHLGDLASDAQRHADALVHYDRALHLSHAIDDYAEQARLLLKLGTLHSARGCVAEARIHWEQGRQLARRIGHQGIEARCLTQLGMLRASEGDLTSAWGLYETVLEVQDRLNDLEGRTQSWADLGWMYGVLGQSDRALDAFARSRADSADRGDDVGVALAEIGTAGVRIRQRRFDEAERHLQGALEVFRAQGHTGREAEGLAHLGELERARGDLSRSRDLLGRALERADEAGSQKARERICAALAVVELDLGYAATALQWAEAAESLLAATPPGLEDARIHYRLSRVFRDAGPDARARRHLEKARTWLKRLASQLTDHQDRAAFERTPLYRGIDAADRARFDRDDA